MVLILLGSLLGSVTGAEPVRYKDWAKNCSEQPDGTRACNLVQDVTDQKSGSVMLRAEVGYIPGSKTALMLITVPLGVALRPGLEFRVDNAKSWKLLFDVCARDGCRAATPMDGSLIAALKRGAQATVSISNLGGRGLVIPISLLGFTKGFSSLSP